jgi:hypothetical protein
VFLDVSAMHDENVSLDEKVTLKMRKWPSFAENTRGIIASSRQLGFYSLPNPVVELLVESAS